MAFAPDLMDRSRLAAPAATARADLVLVGRLADLAEAAAGADLVLVDLGRAGALDAVAGLGAPVVGFAAHVDEATLAAAASAGVEALARSVFFRRLPGLLGE
ncbi:MAG: hypothetical protein GEV08_12480 [Acidimicrobiia bacterium]|nr:hypothetical protein [Acidimicrobiia bacterium]